MFIGHEYILEELVKLFFLPRDPVGKRQLRDAIIVIDMQGRLTMKSHDLHAIHFHYAGVLHAFLQVGTPAMTLDHAEAIVLLCTAFLPASFEAVVLSPQSSELARYRLVQKHGKANPNVVRRHPYKAALEELIRIFRNGDVETFVHIRSALIDNKICTPAQWDSYVRKYLTRDGVLVPLGDTARFESRKLNLERAQELLATLTFR